MSEQGIENYPSSEERFVTATRERQEAIFLKIPTLPQSSDTDPGSSNQRFNPVTGLKCTQVAERAEDSNVPIGIKYPILDNAYSLHSYASKPIKIHGLPIPKRGEVLGLVGANGVGKSTLLKILAQKLKPNLGRPDNPPDWQQLFVYFRGSGLDDYFAWIFANNPKSLLKPQHVGQIKKVTRGTVGKLLDRKDERNMKEQLCLDLGLIQIMDRKVEHLSSGELQRFAIAYVVTQNAGIYMFDEPSSFLDVKQRFKAAQVIRSLRRPDSYVAVVEHDLGVLDYLSDSICCLYGKPLGNGVESLPVSFEKVVNIFSAGFMPIENLKFRQESHTFKVTKSSLESADELGPKPRYKYPTMRKTRGSFKLKVMEVECTGGEIIVMLGENGTGKTTFLHMLAGLLVPDTSVEMPELTVSFKPQELYPRTQDSVWQLVYEQIYESTRCNAFFFNVMVPLQVDRLMLRKIQTLSRGELQRVEICLCLGKPADIYLIDEPSVHLDAEQRIVASKVIKWFIHESNKTAFVVEHDFAMATYLADEVIVHEGSPSIDCVANSPRSLLEGVNVFLSHLDKSDRRDLTVGKPVVINKLNWTRGYGSYYYLDD